MWERKQQKKLRDTKVDVDAMAKVRVKKETEPDGTFKLTSVTNF